MTSLVSLQWGNVNKSEKLKKSLNIENQIFISSEQLEDKKAGFHAVYRKHIFGETTGTGGESNWPAQPILGLKTWGTYLGRILHN